MSFDWGSFAGGVIGTMGAFGTAFWSMKREEKRLEPERRAKQIEVALELFDIVFNSVPRMHRTNDSSGQGPTLTEATGNLTNYITRPLERLLPRAYEAGGGTYELILQIRTELMGVVNKFFDQLPKDELHATQLGSEKYGREFVSEICTFMVGKLGDVKKLNDRIQGLE